MQEDTRSLNPLKSGLCLRRHPAIQVEHPFDESQSPQIGALSPSEEPMEHTIVILQCLNPLKSGLCLRLVVLNAAHKLLPVSIPSNRGSVSVFKRRFSKWKPKGGLNPLKSGLCLRPVESACLYAHGELSQSPQIGALSPSKPKCPWCGEEMGLNPLKSGLCLRRNKEILPRERWESLNPLKSGLCLRRRNFP